MEGAYAAMQALKSMLPGGHDFSDSRLYGDDSPSKRWMNEKMRNFKRHDLNMQSSPLSNALLMGLPSTKPEKDFNILGQKPGTKGPSGINLKDPSRVGLNEAKPSNTGYRDGKDVTDFLIETLKGL